MSRPRFSFCCVATAVEAAADDGDAAVIDASPASSSAAGMPLPSKVWSGALGLPLPLPPAPPSPCGGWGGRADVPFQLSGQPIREDLRVPEEAHVQSCVREHLQRKRCLHNVRGFFQVHVGVCYRSFVPESH